MKIKLIPPNGTNYKPIFIDTVSKIISNVFIGKSLPPKPYMGIDSLIPIDKVLVMTLESRMNDKLPLLPPFSVNQGFGFAPASVPQNHFIGKPLPFETNHSDIDKPLPFETNQDSDIDPTSQDLSQQDFITNRQYPKFFTKLPEEALAFMPFLTDESKDSTIKVEVLNNTGDVLFTDNIVNYGYHYVKLGTIENEVTLEDVLRRTIMTKIDTGDFCLK